MIALGDCALDPEPGERKRESKADDPGDQAVNPFPEENELEVGQRHPGRSGDFDILRDLLVVIKGLLPLRVVQRRQDTRNRLPFGDRKAGFGQTGDAANGHDEHHEGSDDKKPAGKSLGTGRSGCHERAPCSGARQIASRLLGPPCEM